MNIFLNLPGEIRNRIYELSLIEGHEDQESIELEQVSPDSAFHRMRTYLPGDGHSEQLRVAGLPLTSQAIRCETLRLYYSLNKFYFQTEYLKSQGKLQIIQCIEEWVSQIGEAQAKEIRDVTISLSSLKGQTAPSEINWEHMRMLRTLFHPKGSVRIKFCLEGNGTATFTLGKKEETLRELERMERTWCWLWQMVRRLTESEARILASVYRREVERLFEAMPEEV